MQALEGLKVVEVGNIIAGPWCGSMLADFGATVKTTGTAEVTVNT